MQYEYKTSGTCAGKIVLEIEGDVIQSARFIGGCPGNTAGIAKLVAGMKVDDVIERLQGICCGPKATSCPDQLAKALLELKK